LASCLAQHATAGGGLHLRTAAVLTALQLRCDDVVQELFAHASCKEERKKGRGLCAAAGVLRASVQGNWLVVRPSVGDV
jgi:hypothetical protein